MNLIPLHSNRLIELVDLWNKELKNVFPMRQELFNQNSFLDENICHKGSRLAINKEGNVIGFITVKYYQEQLEVGIPRSIGWIQSLLVDSNYRNNGVGTQLLHHAEAILKEKNIKHVILGRDPWHYFPGIPSYDSATCKWFEKRGYHSEGTEHDMICSYANSEIVQFPNKEDVTFSILHKSEKIELIAFLHRCFPGRWEYEARHYFRKGGTGREFVVLKKGNQIIGFCRINDEQSPLIAQNVYWSPLFAESLGGIGPLGVDASQRKNGYGLAIVQAAIAFLRKRGIQRIVIDWTGLVSFYNKLGYTIWKSYESYKKEL
ncbi:GNAT family N-acetyltransferase [Ornithinibacillus xuwenensis]|uniref:GNAT family N-acetyltransferase n=1 Tax=Ornithinibacillus xuwenensis TaxID=3144668 RepID=A0ABU9XK55_9BACI